GQPPGGWTHLALLVAIAKLGGFLARKHDGTPGWQSIWRGWQRLMLISEVVRLAREWSLKCG
ncbi:MAG: IS4 family transposase, partial [Planctomycetota bacterium]|nr:IS4 family transposase [Planctomycetota bacterium]